MSKYGISSSFAGTADMNATVDCPVEGCNVQLKLGMLRHHLSAHQVHHTESPLAALKDRCGLCCGSSVSAKHNANAADATHCLVSMSTNSSYPKRDVWKPQITCKTHGKVMMSSAACRKFSRTNVSSNRVLICSVCTSSKEDAVFCWAYNMRNHWQQSHRSYKEGDPEYDAMMKETAITDAEKNNLEKVLTRGSIPRNTTFESSLPLPGPFGTSSAQASDSPQAAALPPFSGNNITVAGAAALGLTATVPGMRLSTGPTVTPHTGETAAASGIESNKRQKNN